MTLQQQGDVLLFQTDDDGEIELTDGLIQMSSGRGTAAYLSLFGGDEDDDGLDDNPKNWWGNLGEPAERQYRSEFQNLLRSLPAVTSNLNRLQAAAERDLAWFVPRFAKTVLVVVTMPGLNKVKTTINIDADETIEFIENWKVNP